MSIVFYLIPPKAGLLCPQSLPPFFSTNPPPPFFHFFHKPPGGYHLPSVSHLVMFEFVCKIIMTLFRSYFLYVF